MLRSVHANLLCQREEVTYTAKLSEDFPHSSFIESRENATVLPQEMREVTQRTELSLNEERLVFLPAVDVSEHIWMPIPETTSTCCTGKMLESINFFA